MNVASVSSAQRRLIVVVAGIHKTGRSKKRSLKLIWQRIPGKVGRFRAVECVVAKI